MGKKTGLLNIYLIWREPGTILDLKALALIQSCALNVRDKGGRELSQFIHKLVDNDINVLTDYGTSKKKCIKYPWFGFAFKKDYQTLSHSLLKSFYFNEMINSFHVVQEEWLNCLFDLQ